jgi:hypothetical protein
VASNLLVQVDLRSECWSTNEDGYPVQDGYLRQTCWVEPKVKVGDSVTLKDTPEPQRLWEVMRVGQVQSASDIKRGWSNNV